MAPLWRSASCSRVLEIKTNDAFDLARGGQRPIPHLRAGGGAADGPAVLFVLECRHVRYRNQTAAKRPLPDGFLCLDAGAGAPLAGAPLGRSRPRELD